MSQNQDLPPNLRQSDTPPAQSPNRDLGRGSGNSQRSQASSSESIRPWRGQSSPPPDLGQSSTSVPPPSPVAPISAPVMPSHGDEPSPEPTPPPKSPSVMSRLVARLARPKSWQFWAAMIVVGFSSTGLIAAALLLKLPGLPNCPSIFWPTASASLRLYCAQVAANKQTVDDLLEAITLVRRLPPDHPLRAEADRYVEQWSLDILRLGDEAFHSGDLTGAIDIAERIPLDTPARELVKERIERWQSVWQRAEEIYELAEEELRKEDLPKAFRQAVRLLNVGNEYWQTTKYDELVGYIATARQDAAQLAKARNLARRGGLENLLEAIKLARKLGPKSYLHEEAKNAVKEFGGKLLNLAEARLARRDLPGALEVIDKIPEHLGLEEEATDFAKLARARSRAWEGTVDGLQEAIAIAESVGIDRPMRGKAQDLIYTWQQEIGDVVKLSRARNLAQGGDIGSLRAAIVEAEQVPLGNPRGREARKQIGRWENQIETIEDRPYLNSAEQIAAGGDVSSLKAAIQEAQRIAPGRALYSDAQKKVRQWKTTVERIEDQPLLDRAKALAASGNMASAIATAERIRSGRALYRDAQTLAKQWRADVEGNQYFREANRIASQAVTPEVLLSAINTAKRVPRASNVYSSAQAAINGWSLQILNLAEDRATYDPAGAIAIARKIPAGNDAYSRARSRISAWEAQLAPPSTPEAEPSAIAN